MYYKRYVDDIFVLFEKLEQVCDLLIILTKNAEILNFRLKLKKITPFLFSTLKFVDKNINLQQVFPKKMRSMVYTLILVVT